MIVGATREGLLATPRHVREASLALGKTRAATIHRVLLPVARPNIATGCALGMGRIAGDTAVVLLLGGGTLLLETEGVDSRRERAARDRLDADDLRLHELARRARAARSRRRTRPPSCCWSMVLVLNWAVDRIARGGSGRLGWTR